MDYRAARAGSPWIGEVLPWKRRERAPPWRHDRDPAPPPPCPRRCGWARSTSPSPTSTARSASTRTRSACGSTGATATSPRSAPAARTCSSSTRRRSRAPPAATPGSTTSRCCTLARGARPRARAARRDPHADLRRLRPRRLGGDLPPDPDGNGIELYADRPRDAWPPAARATRAASRAARRARPDRPRRRRGAVRHADPGLSIGHLHLHVGDIERGPRFYRDVSASRSRPLIPSALFVAAGGYHHHLGFNIWRGEGVRPAPPAPSACASGPSCCRPTALADGSRGSTPRASRADPGPLGQRPARVTRRPARRRACASR